MKSKRDYHLVKPQKGVSSMSTEDNKAIARRLYEEAWNKGNIAAVDELVAPNIILHYDYPADNTGPAENQLHLEEVKQFVSQLRTTFPDYHFTVELQVAEGDLVVTRGTARGTHQGEYWGITFQSILPTGKQVTWTETVIDRIVDGKIAESWINEDALGRLQQIAALPTPGQAS
jgi:predicted ester cyclase